MPLDPLATTADLNNRKIDTSDVTLVDELLESASAAVRDAAGVAITETTATIKLATPLGRELRLPGPVRSVAAVLLDGEAITDWKLRGSSLWRENYWQCRADIPSEATITFTFGLTSAPKDIVDLVCNLVGAGVAHAADGYEARAGLVGKSEQIDDYQRSRQYAQGSNAVVTPMELPERTRNWLASRFGGGVSIVESRA